MVNDYAEDIYMLRRRLKHAVLHECKFTV